MLLINILILLQHVKRKNIKMLDLMHDFQFPKIDKGKLF